MSSTKTPDNPFISSWDTRPNDGTETPVYGDALNGKTISVSKTKNITLTIPVKNKSKEMKVNMDKKLVYQIQINLSTDGDFAFRKDLLPAGFIDDDCREILVMSEEALVCNIYDKDMTAYKWESGEWGTYTARSTIEQYVSAMHVSFTHLYIWEDLLKCVEECSRWLYHPEDFENKNLFISSMSGNYDGTDFIITRVKKEN